MFESKIVEKYLNKCVYGTVISYIDRYGWFKVKIIDVLGEHIYTFNPLDYINSEMELATKIILDYTSNIVSRFIDTSNLRIKD